MSGRAKLNTKPNTSNWTLIAGERGDRTEQMPFAQGWLVRTTLIGAESGPAVSMIYVPDAAQTSAMAESLSLRLMAEGRRLAEEIE